MKRKEFIKLAASGAVGLSSVGYIACEKEKELFFKLSLAQWSFHRAIQNGIMSPYTFAQNAKSLGFDGIEYVNALYDDVMKVENKSDALKNFIKKNNELAMDNNIENVLIMIDSEGDLANEDNNIKASLESELFFYSKVLGFETNEKLFEVKIENL